jgi:hypothetical protein
MVAIIFFFLHLFYFYVQPLSTDFSEMHCRGEHTPVPWYMCYVIYEQSSFRHYSGVAIIALNTKPYTLNPKHWYICYVQPL